MPLLSPRRAGLNDWKPKATGLLLAKSKLPRICSVLVSALVLLGPKVFLERFTGSRDSFACLSPEDRKKLFTGPKRIPSEVVLSCLLIAHHMGESAKSLARGSANARQAMFQVLETSLAWDDIHRFQAIDNVTEMHAVMDLIMQMEEWTYPQVALLGPTFHSLEMMGCMFECEPTPDEEQEQFANEMIRGATSIGGLCVRVGKVCCEMLKPTALPVVVKEKTWQEIVVEGAPVVLHLWIWMWCMYTIVFAWLRGLYAKMSIDPQNFTQSALKMTELCEESSTGSMEHAMHLYIFLLSFWRREVNYWTRTLLLCSISMGMAHSMPLHRFKMFFADAHYCHYGWMSRDAIRFFMVFIAVVYPCEVCGTLLREAWMKQVRTRITTANLHIPFYSRTCAVYILTISVIINAPQWLNLVVVVSLFVVIFLLSLHPDYNKTNVSASSMFSLYASRMLCLVIILGHIFTCSTACQWEMTFQRHLLIEFGIIHQKMVVIYGVAVVRNIIMCRI